MLVASILASVSASGCASTRGWTLDEARTCERDAAPRACVSGPDHGHVLALADIELLPGECAAAPREAKAGALRVATRDPRGVERRRWIAARRGRVARLLIDERGRVEVDHDRCTASP